jgi:hypothetical protein
MTRPLRPANTSCLPLTPAKTFGGLTSSILRIGANGFIDLLV